MPNAGSPIASATPAKPKLKISINRQPSVAGDSGAAPLPTATPASAVSSTTAATPTTGAPRVIKLKRPSIHTPAGTPPLPSSAKTKAGRQTKPTKKIVEANINAAELDDESSERNDGLGHHSSKKIKLKARPKSLTTQVVIKSKGKAPKRELGTGYDSEASDREEDPVIEEQFIIRMLPGEHCDYIHKAIEENKMDPKSMIGNLGADIFMRFLDEVSGRAVISVKGQMFAAVMVDLPTITESMKTWDRKSFIKSADICQMLLVFQMVASEAEALSAPLPKVIHSSTSNIGGPTVHKWPHGLTPPMHDCTKRRFAKTLSRKEIQDKEKEVERLLAADREAKDSRFTWIEDKPEVQQDEGTDGEQDAEGEEDEPNPEDMVEAQAFDDADLEAEMEAALEEDLMGGDLIGELMGEQNTPGTQMEGETPATMAAETPAAHPGGESGNEEGDDDDEDDEDEEDGEENEEVDEEEQARLSEIQGVRDIIADLRKQLSQKQQELGRQSLPILRQRLENSIRTLKSEIRLKLASIGEEED